MPTCEQFAHRLLLEVAPPEVQPQEGSVAKVCERTFTRDWRKTGAGMLTSTEGAPRFLIKIEEAKAGKKKVSRRILFTSLSSASEGVSAGLLILISRE